MRYPAIEPWQEHNRNFEHVKGLKRVSETIYLEARYIGHPSESVALECDRVERHPGKWQSQIGADGGIQRSQTSLPYILAFGLSEIDPKPEWTHVAWEGPEDWREIVSIDQHMKPTRITVKGN